MPRRASKGAAGANELTRSVRANATVEVPLGGVERDRSQGPGRCWKRHCQDKGERSGQAKLVPRQRFDINYASDGDRVLYGAPLEGRRGTECRRVERSQEPFCVDRDILRHTGPAQRARERARGCEPFWAHAQPFAEGAHEDASHLARIVRFRAGSR